MMKRSEMRRLDRESRKNNTTFVMTREELEKIRRQEYDRARKTIKEKSDRIAEDILKMMIVIPTNVLINDYWEKTAKKRIPKFVEDCMSLYRSWSEGTVSMEEMQHLTEEYAGIKLIDSGSDIEKTMNKKR